MRAASGLGWAAGLLAAWWIGQAAAAPSVLKPPSVLKTVRQQGVVRCSVSTASGFAAHDDAGRPVGLMVDLCRAVAAATLGNANAIELRRFSRLQEYRAVESGEVDVSFAMNGWTLTNPAGGKVAFGPPVFYDSQGLAAWRSPSGAAIPEAARTVVCVPAESSAERNMTALIRRTGRKWTLRAANSIEDALQAFLGKECAMLSANRAALVIALGGLQRAADRDIVIDPEPISRQALAPMVSTADHQWESIVRWTIFALFLAEEKGVTSANLAGLKTAGDQETRRLLDGVPVIAQALGLADDWVVNVIAQVGNYGEIYDRNLGAKSPYHLPRGPNKPWNDGGLLYPPPFQ